MQAHNRYVDPCEAAHCDSSGFVLVRHMPGMLASLATGLTYAGCSKPKDCTQARHGNLSLRAAHVFSMGKRSTLQDKPLAAHT